MIVWLKETRTHSLCVITCVCLKPYSVSLSPPFFILGKSGAGWGWRRGSRPASPRGGTKWSAGGTGWILTSITPHCSYNLLFKYVRTVIRIFLFFLMVYFCSLQDWAHEATSWIEAPSHFLYLCSLFNVFCDFWWTAVAGLWWPPLPADTLRPSQKFPRTVWLENSFLIVR